MSSLTSDIKDNRGFFSRYKRFFWLVAMILFVVAAGVGAYFIFPDEDGEGVAKAERTLPSRWLIQYFGTDDENDPAVGGYSGDPDSDVLTNLQEFYFGTDPTNDDTDGDGQIDGAEIALNRNPTGEGELYSTDYAKSVTDRFLEDHRLAEFKEENIQKQVMGLLNPPDEEGIEIELPSSNDFKVIDDDSPEAADRYFQAINNLAQETDANIDVLTKFLESKSTQGNAQILIGQIYETVDRLRNAEVPIILINYHQLQIAGLFSSVEILQLSQEYSDFQAMEEQQDILQRQYYQVAKINKISDLLLVEHDAISERYPDVMQKYTVVNLYQ